MTELLRAGRFRGIVAETVADIDKALSLRAKLFRAGACDRDHFDAKCTHVLIVDDQSVAVCTFRLLPLANGSEISRSYSAQSYDLSALSAFPAPMVEIGRFCIEPGPADADILRLASDVVNLSSNSRTGAPVSSASQLANSRHSRLFWLSPPSQ